MDNVSRPPAGARRQPISWLQILFLMHVWTCLQAQVLKNTRWPLYSGKPLLLAWNAPTEDCRPRHEITFQLDPFQIVASPTEGFTNQNLTIFYTDRLGLYPHYNTEGLPVNGGLPQAASLTQHLEKMPEGLNKYIKDPMSKGLAVIDWEDWRPLWIRNWAPKDIYRNHSRRLVSQKNPTWPPDQVAKVAQQDFELSARKFMLETLKLAKSKRPNQLWGFYLFPDCYNHNYQQVNYTGRCPDVEVTRNDQLRWLWTESTALYPSIYMGKALKNDVSRKLFVRNRVKEGMRLASVGDGAARPVFVYTRPTYANEILLLSEMDLVSTIGESVALGVAGVIFWGDSTYASSEANCKTLNDYLRGPLGRYLLNVTSAAEQCSRKLCNFHGRCLRRQSDTDTYLHLNPNTHSIEPQGNVLKVSGQMGTDELNRLQKEFQCQCYNNYIGEDCNHQIVPENRGMVFWTTWLQVLLLPLVLLGFLH